MAEQIDIKISQESVASIINAHVQTAVAEALSKNTTELVNTLVKQALLVKSKDPEYQYKRDNEVPTVLEHMVRAMIRDETGKAIKAWADENRKEIAKKIEYAIQKRGFAGTWATQVVDQMLAANEYRFNTTVTLATRER